MSRQSVADLARLTAARHVLGNGGLAGAVMPAGGRIRERPGMRGQDRGFRTQFAGFSLDNPCPRCYITARN